MIQNQATHHVQRKGTASKPKSQPQRMLKNQEHLAPKADPPAKVVLFYLRPQPLLEVFCAKLHTRGCSLKSAIKASCASMRAGSSNISMRPLFKMQIRCANCSVTSMICVVKMIVRPRAAAPRAYCLKQFSPRGSIPDAKGS